jgi:hypothetical protein
MQVTLKKDSQIAFPLGTNRLTVKSADPTIVDATTSGTRCVLTAKKCGTVALSLWLDTDLSASLTVTVIS